MKIANRLAVVLAASVLPLISFAQTSSVSDLGELVINTINDVFVPVLFAVAFVVFLWGVVVAYVISRGDTEKVKEGHRLILWGIIGFVVMLSVWGLVNVLSTTLGLSGEGAPEYPTI